jgi:hypothetical protein
MLRQALPAVAIGRNPAILASPCGVVIFILFFWGEVDSRALELIRVSRSLA